MDDFATLTGQLMPTARRPLLGLTVLVVEDSRFACDALRLMCLRSGARIRRADCLASARRHLQVYRPSVVIVDMGLPDGSGAELIEELAGNAPRIGVLLAISGDETAEAEAMRAGADGFLGKPLASLATFQEAILSRLPAERQPLGPRAVSDDVIHPDPVAYHDDLRHAAETLSRKEGGRGIGYVSRFLHGIALSAGDTALAQAVEAVRNARRKKTPAGADLARLTKMLKDRIEREPAI